MMTDYKMELMLVEDNDNFHIADENDFIMMPMTDKFKTLRSKIIHQLESLNCIDAYIGGDGDDLGHCFFIQATFILSK